MVICQYVAFTGYEESRACGRDLNWAKAMSAISVDFILFTCIWSPVRGQRLRSFNFLSRHLTCNVISTIASQIYAKRTDTLRAREVVPHVRQNEVLSDAAPQFIHEPEIHLRRDQTLIGCLAIPTRRCDVVLRHPFTLGIHKAERDLGLSVPSIGGLTVPLRRLDIVLGHAMAGSVHTTQGGLSSNIALLRRPAIGLSGFSIPFRSLGLVFRDA